MPTSIASCKINKINKIFVFFSGKYNVLRGSSGKAGDMFYYKIFYFIKFMRFIKVKFYLPLLARLTP